MFAWEFLYLYHYNTLKNHLSWSAPFSAFSFLLFYPTVFTICVCFKTAKNIPDKSVARYQHISTCRWHKLWNGNLKWKNLNFTKSYCTTWIKQNNLSSYPNVWKCHLPKQNSLSNWPANWIVVKINVSTDDNSVGWEQENRKTFWLYLCRAVTKVIGNRQIKAHSITNAVEIPCPWICTQLRSCDLSLSYDNEPTQLRTKRMLENTISSIPNVFYFLYAAQ